MLKLTRHLFAWTPTAESMDFYERALFNHILGSQDPKTGQVIYYCPLKPGAFKTFSTPTDSFWCCVGTGMENHGKYNDTIYFHDEASLYVNLFIPSELSWKDKGLTVRQLTKYPEQDSSSLSITAAKPVKLSTQGALSRMGDERHDDHRERPSADRDGKRRVPTSRSSGCGRPATPWRFGCR